MKQIHLVAVTPTNDTKWDQPLICRTDEVRELREAVEALDPGAVVTVIHPVSPIFVVAYLAELSRGPQAAGESATLAIAKEG